MSKFAEECKRRIKEAGIEPRELILKVEPFSKMEEEAIMDLFKNTKGERLDNTEVFCHMPSISYFNAMVNEFKKPSERQKLFEAKKEIEYLTNKCKKLNAKCVSLIKEKKSLNAKCEDYLKNSIKFENEYINKNRELVEEVTQLKKENEELKDFTDQMIRNNVLLTSEVEEKGRTISIFGDEISSLWERIVNINLESKEGKEKFKEMQHQAARSRDLFLLGSTRTK